MILTESLGLPCGVRRGRIVRRLCAFSLIELLVVIAILGILLTLVYSGGGALIDSSKARDTEGLFGNLTQAIETYKSDVSQSRIAYAADVFKGGVPPDDLYVFTAEPSASLPGSTQAGCGTPIRMTQGNPTIITNPVRTTYVDLRNTTSGAITSPGDRWFGDVRAMILAMRLRSPKASAILDRIDSRFVKSDGAMFDPDGVGPELPTTPLVYYVDAWGTPIEYFATSKCSTNAALTPRLTPRVEASNAFVRANNGAPVLVSYGPNGSDQFSADFFNDVGDTSVVADWFKEFNATGVGWVNDSLNQDNIYSSTVFIDRLGGR